MRNNNISEKGLHKHHLLQFCRLPGSIVEAQFSKDILNPCSPSPSPITTKMDPSFQEEHPRPHPYLHEPLLHITNLPPFVSDENLAVALMQCSPFRPRINRDGSASLLSGTIEFKFLEKGDYPVLHRCPPCRLTKCLLGFLAEKALAILQSRNIPDLPIPVPLVLSPYPPTTPPTPLPPPSAMPRLVKQLPSGFTDSQLYDIFRPYGALASARTPTQFGPDTGMIEFWNEEDAQMAEEALHCAEVEGQNIAVQLYPRRPTHTVREFNVAAPSFVPAPVNFSPFHPQVNIGYFFLTKSRSSSCII